MTYPKRLIEVDLPIKEISAHARREKSIRHGHISTLHIWWARRPLAACRAVLCAALWPDPVDDLCPQDFRERAADILIEFAGKVRENTKLGQLCASHWNRWKRTNAASLKPDNPGCWGEMRYALLDFIADFANWDASTVPEFLDAARALTQAAHEALGGIPGTRPLVVDPFAGGGSIPLEALRVGADAFASDLNPVAVLLNKVVLEYIPKYGNYEFSMTDAEGQESTFHGLAEAVRYWGNWIKEQAEQELAQFYPKDEDGATPIAYLWARTITCEGPGCGAQVPLMRSLWLAKKSKKSVALRILSRLSDKSDKSDKSDSLPSTVNFEIFEPASAKEVGEGTVKRGAATCPCCGYTTPVESVRKQLKARRGGAHDARLFAVVTTRAGQKGRFYRLPTERDMEAVRKAAAELERRKTEHSGELSLVPDEPTPDNKGHRAVGSAWIYGMETWGDLFSPRQTVSLITLIKFLHETEKTIVSTTNNSEFYTILKLCLALALDRQADFTSSLCSWWSGGEKIQHTFARQALPMIWDFSEVNPWSDSTGCWTGAYKWGALFCEHIRFSVKKPGNAAVLSAINHSLPNDSIDCFITDPPYYDSVPYADLADFFYVWLKRTVGLLCPELLREVLTPKQEQAIVWHPNSTQEKNNFVNKMTTALSEGRRILNPHGVGTVVFAHKSTSGWEAQIQAMIEAGWMITASWPIDTEMGTRVNAMGTASLASSIHLVCRPRENADGTLREEVGDWRDVLQALPKRIHAWMPRLAQEGIVGADAIFACIGPALEIFSQYSRVEKASGELVTLREYLEHVWAAVSQEALDLVFAGADTADFEQDARLTAMWLWTLSTNEELQESDIRKNEEGETKVIKSAGYTLEYDTARKIAQGLGAHLEQLSSTLEIQGDKARLLPVAARRNFLLGKDAQHTPDSARSRKNDAGQLSFGEAASAATANGVAENPWQAYPSEQPALERIGATMLDQVHQSMLLFADGRSDTLRRFLVDDGVGKNPRFWKLADCLSKLYPAHTDEKRWVDGVLARKRGLGL